MLICVLLLVTELSFIYLD